MSPSYYTLMDSPAGPLLIQADAAGRLEHILFMRDGEDPQEKLGIDGDLVEDDSDGPTAATVEQLREYFAGERRDFDLDLAPAGSDFQQKVWRLLVEIPFGETSTYGELAERLGRPGAARAVGRANGTNPISIVIPCHRVIGADGTLTGYGGGLDTKRVLLELEGWGEPGGQLGLKW